MPDPTTVPDNAVATVHWTWFDAPAEWNTNGQWQALSWEEARARVEQADLWPGGGSLEYARNQLPGLSFARFRGDSREPTPGEAPLVGGGARVVGVWGLVVEYDDDPTISGEEVLRRWAPWRLLAYTTAHNLQPRADQPPGPRWRVLLPFSHAVSPEEARRIARWARHPRRLAGVIDARVEDPAAWYAAPGLAPGGYEHTTRDEGPLLDPAHALAELGRWNDEARLERARTVLAGTSLAERVVELAGRDGRTLSWPRWLGLDEVVGPLRPGAVITVSSEVVGARRTLALAVARATARSGAPVLHVATSCTMAEVVGRLLSLDGEAPPWRLLAQGAVEPALVERLAGQLAAQCPRLHLWGPEASGRTWAATRDEWSALADASDGPGLVVLDDPQDLDAVDARALGLALRDLADLSVEGRRAAVIAVVRPEVAALAPADVRLHLEVSPRGRAELVLGTADGAVGRRSLGFDPVTGRLGRLAAEAPEVPPMSGVAS